MIELLQQLHGMRINRAGWPAARAVSSETTSTEPVEDGFGENAPGRIAGAKKQHVRCGHGIALRSLFAGSILQEIKGRLSPLHSNYGIFLTLNIAHAKVFATLGNETRLRCLYLAAKHDEVCVCEAVDTLKIPQPTVSKAFKALKTAGLVSDRRDANWTYYFLNPAMPGWLRSTIFIVIRDLDRSGRFAGDDERFEARPNPRRC
jgi:ArsR family transcriptional regulator